jgi:hypothetical protein
MDDCWHLSVLKMKSSCLGRLHLAFGITVVG